MADESGTKGVGSTQADAEMLMYTDKGLAKDLARRISLAEKNTGRKTGVRMVDRTDGVRSVRVSVSFYPKEKWYIADVMADGSYGEARDFTDQEYQSTRGLIL